MSATVRCNLFGKVDNLICDKVECRRIRFQYLKSFTHFTWKAFYIRIRNQKKGVFLAKQIMKQLGTANTY